MVLTANGTRPPYQFRVLIPNEMACAKLSWPRRIPESRARKTTLLSTYHIRKSVIGANRLSSDMLSVRVETT
jgi:hypothetical protein